MSEAELADDRQKSLRMMRRLGNYTIAPATPTTSFFFPSGGFPASGVRIPILVRPGKK
jgi:hypothetical protein